jgi:hypothetical protein
MKQVISLFVFIIIFSGNLFAGECKNCKIWKVFDIAQKSILITDDYEMWELNYLKQNNKTWSEWYNGKTHVQIDEKYIISKSWNENSSISISFYPWTSSAEAVDYLNYQDDLNLCSHILINMDNQEKIFARQINKNEFIEVYNKFLAEFPAALRICKPEAKKWLEEHIAFLEFKIKIKEELVKFIEKKDYDQKYLDFDNKYNFSSITIEDSLSYF